ncbi:hypothetical protein ABFS83_02G001100 [Erythranthe nasuta]
MSCWCCFILFIFNRQVSFLNTFLQLISCIFVSGFDLVLYFRMVQQTKDSTFTEYGLAHVQSGLSNSDKPLSAFVPAKTSELQSSCNENPMTVSKSIGSPLLMENSECAGEVVKMSGTKRPISECQHSPPRSNVGSGHIVYVRRKPETDLAKSNVSHVRVDAVDCPPAKRNACHIRVDTVVCPPSVKSSDQGEATQQRKEMNEHVISVSDIPSLQRASSPSFSSTGRSVSPSLGMSNNISSPENMKHAHVDCANPTSEDPIMVNVALWEKRYCRLQSLLKMLDQSDQYEYVQMLRSLSSVELSRHAVELERRSIKLSLEEAKEMQRVGLFDVLGKYGKKVCTPSTQQEQQQVHK